VPGAPGRSSGDELTVLRPATASGAPSAPTWTTAVSRSATRSACRSPVEAMATRRADLIVPSW